ncbi:putative exocyst complex component Sec8/EXOC4 [Helianthus anomalus]
MALHLPFASLMLRFLARGIYLAASVYRPVVQFTDRLSLMMPRKYSQLGNDGLLAFLENFVKDHFLPTLFVDYRKGMQQAISSKFYLNLRINILLYCLPLNYGFFL